MALVRIVLAVAAEKVASVIEALTLTEAAYSIQIGEEETPTRQVNGSAEVETTRVTKRRDAGVRRGARIVYMPGKRIDVARIKAFDTLSDTQKEVGIFLVKAANKGNPQSMSEAQRALKHMNRHTVDGSINTLRKHEPPVIVSTPAK